MPFTRVHCAITTNSAQVRKIVQMQMNNFSQFITFLTIEIADIDVQIFTFTDFELHSFAENSIHKLMIWHEVRNLKQTFIECQYECGFCTEEALNRLKWYSISIY